MWNAALSLLIHLGLFTDDSAAGLPSIRWRSFHVGNKEKA